MIDDDVEDLTSTSKGKHGHHEKNQNGEPSSKEILSRGESVDLDNIEDIYDRPKVPPVRYIPADIPQQRDENLQHEKDYKDKSSKPTTMTDKIDDSGNTSDGPVYRTVVKTSKKKNGGGKTTDNSNHRKTSRNSPFDQNEEEFIDSLQVIDAVIAHLIDLPCLLID